MIFFIIGVLAALVALAVLLLSEEGKAAAFIPGVVAVIMIGVSCVSYVPTGYTTGSQMSIPSGMANCLHTLAVMAVFPSSTGSTDFLLPEPPGAAAPFCEHGDRPLPVQARKCPKLTGGKDNAEILSYAAVQQSKKQRKPP